MARGPDPTRTARTGNRVILVDIRDRETGTAEKLDAHRRGMRHRAFSVFVFDETGRCLLQRRAAGKYHSGGLWSNACCSHPRPGEDMADAVARRTAEELGVRVVPEKAFEEAYDLDVGGGLREAEYNHVHLAELAADARLDPDPAEASAVRWAAPEEILDDMKARPERYSAWFRLLFPKVLARRAGRRGG